MDENADDAGHATLYERLLQGKKRRLRGESGFTERGGRVLGVKIGGEGKDDAYDVGFGEIVFVKDFGVESGGLGCYVRSRVFGLGCAAEGYEARYGAARAGWGVAADGFPTVA